MIGSAERTSYLAIGYSQRPLSERFVICHPVICHFLCSAAVGLLDRFIHDLASMRHHTGLKDFVIEI